ncbi:MAG: YggW family oxidoreductase [Beggiatoa sp. IS2]|nr:MAG: YggW family oxidoreductase [Beggiatoa sp. IS2]
MALPLSLYIHFPWCIRKCPYCDFNSYPVRHSIPQTEYLTTLLIDLEQDLSKVAGRELISIFIGGGTPSLFSPEIVEQLLSQISKQIPIQTGAEITLEANPGTVDRHHFKAFHTAGINRLSLGIQSFNEIQLQHIGRIHGRQEAITAIHAVREAGFENFNLDLMFGLPKQTVTMALDDLETAISFQPPHLSWYQLTVEPDTLFYQQPPTLPEEESLWDIYTHGKAYLITQGYHPYEISAYTHSEQYCYHNLNYWTFGDYLGIGAGAHGKITDSTTGMITRTTKPVDPDQYLRSAQTQSKIAETAILTKADIRLEFMMNALRLCDGFTISQFIARTGLNFNDIAQAIQQAKNQGWLTEENQHIRPTTVGMQFLNNLLELFVA